MTATPSPQPTEPDASDPSTFEPEQMAAVVQERYGTDPRAVLTLDRIDRPAIGDDQVLVRVAAAGVDRGTWHLMAGRPYLIRVMGFGLRGPRRAVPGLDVAGTVEAVGPAVTGFDIGDEVFGIADGSFAEYAAASAAKLVPKPDDLSFEEAAAVPVSGLTALQAVRDQARVASGQQVLILGASGGVGTFAVQVAKEAGAEVTGVCSTAKVEMVRGLGADHVLDYTRDDFADGTHRFDAVIDIGGNNRLSRLRRSLAPDGTLVIVGGEEGGRWFGGIDRQLRAMLLSPFVGQKLGTFISSEDGDDLRALGDLVEAGSVTPVVDRTYPLAEAPDAIAHLAEGRARGKVVITVPA